MTAAAIPTPAPARPAPTIPEVFRYWAVTIGARDVRNREYFAYSLLTPPPRMMRSGQNQRSSRAMYSLNSRPHFFQPIPRRSRALPETSVSASFPRYVTCPNSVLSRRWPSMKSALPIPVPIVSSSTVPGTPLAAPKVASARPAASASLTRRTGRSSRVESIASAGASIQDLSMFAAVSSRPAFTTPGNPAPAGMPGVT